MGEKTMKQPVLLCYNLTGEKMQKIRLAAMRLKIRVRPVEKAEFLGLFRRMGIAPVALKAMLTPTNAAWDSEKLHEELAGEHRAMTSGEGKRHQG